MKTSIDEIAREAKRNKNMQEMKEFPIMFCEEGTPIAKMLHEKVCGKGGFAPAQVTFLSKEEFKSLKKHIVLLRFGDKP